MMRKREGREEGREKYKVGREGVRKKKLTVKGQGV
jgi:hypothetical protein